MTQASTPHTPQRFAAMDLGSNTFRLFIAEPVSQATSPNQPSTPWQTIHYSHQIVRLGEGLHHTGQLCDAAMQRAMQALAGFADVLQQFHVPADHIAATATAAMREAGNGAIFRARVAQQIGMDIRIITGETEARLSLTGACAVLQPECRNDILLFDIGGGSTEFIRAQHGQCQDAMSRKMGVVRLVEAHLHTDPPSTSDYQAMLAAADAHLAAVEDSWDDHTPPSLLVGTAGTVTTLAATALDLCPYDASIINNHLMHRAAFEALRDRLLCMDHATRQSIRTIEPGRSDLIIAGLAIVEAVMQRWHYDQMTVVDAGLLEGAWLDISQQNKP